nr:VP2 [Wongorr virus]
MAEPERTQTAKQHTDASPYLRGDEVTKDTGPLLSVFGLQEILAKVRDAQARMRMSAGEQPPAPPDMLKLFELLKSMTEEKTFRIETKPPVYYDHVSTQSDERVFQINRLGEQISQIGDEDRSSDAKGLMQMVLQRVKKIRDDGSFIVHDLPTHYENGNQITDPSALGINVDAALRVFRPTHRMQLQRQLNAYAVENDDVDATRFDIYTAAMPEQIFRVHDALTAYVTQGQRAEFRQSIAWLQMYGDYKSITYDRNLMTDIFYPDTLYVLSYTLPPNPTLIWSVPRCGTANLLINAALGLPPGEYILPNQRIAAVTITSRITTTAPFSQLHATTATEAQMADVRKIYLALMFPNQILLDIKGEPGHAVDPVVRSVAGIIGKIMFSYGPRIFNITPRTARLLDRAASDYLTSLTDERRTIRRGRTGLPLDFVIEQGGRTFDANQLRMDPATGAGYNGWQCADIQRRQTPYPHVTRRVCYVGYDPEDILDERISGMDHEYAMFNLIMEALLRSGHAQERNYMNLMSQHHVVRFAYISQIINRDLLSAFTLPDTAFDELSDKIPLEEITPNGPIILDISYHSIWHAFRMRFLPTEQSPLVLYQPLIETIYSSQLAIMKLNANMLRDFTTANEESFPNMSIMDVWKVVCEELPPVMKTLLDLTGQYWFVNVRDYFQWIREPSTQNSLPMMLMEAAWECALEPSSIMFIRDAYVYRDPIPEPHVEDIELFRREAVYYTNIMDHQPPQDRRIFLPRSAAIQRAGEGRFHIMMRGMIDDGYYVRVGSVLRPVRFEIYTTLPTQETLSSVPYTYRTHKHEGPVACFDFTTAGLVRGFLILYAADDHSTADELVRLNPAFCNTAVVLSPIPFQRVDVNTILNVVQRRLLAVRKKILVCDLTSALIAGSRHAVPMPE